MEFFLEMLLTAVVAVLFSFLVAKLVSASVAGNSGGGVHDQAEKAEIGVGDGSVAAEEELRFGLKVVQRKRKLRVVDEVVVTSDESLAAVSPENVEKVSEEREGEFIVRRTVEEEAESTGSVSPANVIAEEFIVRTVEEAEYTSSVSLENVTAEEIMTRGQEVTSAEDVTRGEPEEVRVEESNRMEESEHKMELNTEEKEEVSIEEEDDDDWEGIERSELEKAFVAASNLLEQSGKAEETSEEVKMELYGLHKIATEGSCRETQPMAIMVSARAKWNAWQKLGNMSQEEAMEQYLQLISKKIPGLMNTVGKIPVSPPNSGSLEDPTNLGFSKNAER